MPKEEITYYQSPIGLPYAIKGKYIATFIARIKGKAKFGSMTLRKFGKENLNKLQEISYGMPEEYKKGLLKVLKGLR